MLSIVIRGVVGLIFLALGLTGVFSPATSRRFISTFLQKAPVRVLGIVLILLGAGMYRVAAHLYFPLLGKTLGVVLFMAGGVHMFIPEFAIVLNEWWVTRKQLWERLVSVVYIGIAVLCFVPQDGLPWPPWPSRPHPSEFRTLPEQPTPHSPAEPASAGPEPASPQEESGRAEPAPDTPPEAE